MSIYVHLWLKKKNKYHLLSDVDNGEGDTQSRDRVYRTSQNFPLNSVENLKMALKK